MAVSPNEIEKTIHRFERAAECSRNSTFRRGNIIDLDDSVDDVLVTTDLHGNRVNFRQLIEIADLSAHPHRHLVLQEVCHGGPIYPGTSGGCMSHLLLEDVAQLQCDHPDRVHFLFSNHELAELTDFPITKSSRMLNLQFRTGMQHLYGSGSDRVRQAAMNFVLNSVLGVRLRNGVFICHSIPEALDVDPLDQRILERDLGEQDFAPGGDVFRLVWGRDFRASNAEIFCELVDAQVLIHGHEPCPHGFQTPNQRQVIIDCAGWNACYLLLTNRLPLTHADVVDLIRHLHGEPR
ncbi:MAG: hypothetical protein QGG36_01020 [Pirellulaceae bacterium]|jgi:hypothetical protein|nr:hypothetical protein [Pirellulaceae bacterium]